MLNYYHTLANEIFTLFAHAFESSFTELYMNILYLSPYFEFASNEGSVVRVCTYVQARLRSHMRYVSAFHMKVNRIYSTSGGGGRPHSLDNEITHSAQLFLLG